MLHRKKIRKARSELKSGLKWTLLFILAILPSLLRASPPALTVLVSVRPIELIVNEITEGLPVDVSVLLKEGSTPHDYTLKPSDVMFLKQAGLTVWLGPESESYLAKLIRQTANAISWGSLSGLHLLPLRQAWQQDAHSQEHHSGHDSEFDLHFWFSVENAIVFAKAIEQKMVQQHPEWKAILQRNVMEFQTRLQQQLKMQKELQNEAKAFFSVHDAHLYLEADLGLHSLGTLISDPELQPGIKHVMTMKQKIQTEKARCVLIDPVVSTALLDKLEGNPPFRRIVIDPLAWDFKGEQYSDWLNWNYQKMMACISGK